MWCRNILRTRTIRNKPVIFACLQRLTNNNFDGVTLKYPARRLFVSDARGCTIGDVIDQWSRRFESEGVPEPVESIEHIVAHVIGIKKIIDILNVRNDPLNASQLEKLESLCECRLSRMPVQYIIGEWDFRDITVKLVPPIFIPRPETEILVDFVLKRLSSSQADSCKILEIGCGSGAMSLALAHACKRIKCTAIDASPHACDLTMINRSNLDLTEQVTVIHANLKSDANIEVLSNLNGADNEDLNSRLFDFVISNPPYVPTKKIPELQPEIRIYEDLRALDGGDDGLKVIKPLLKYAAKALKPGGRLFVEVDPTHPEYVQFFTNKYPDLKLYHEHTYKDFCNNDRFVEVMKVA
ncbi:PREDICTED: hemK methyltransferase family member 1-like [Wasmannia auropunctata]|uniref:hemK methyltransferase family member 1-like n=1 Tax=Wasmannia auropunctata TaxID=64793 RepID=UPI0005F01203|nr:PREDICTED: hemK methyltransferase family member 1-like [Wasmannia auropunctata]